MIVQSGEALKSSARWRTGAFFVIHLRVLETPRRSAATEI